MKQLEILEEFKKLSPEERLEVVEAALRIIREDLQKTKKLSNREARRLRLEASAQIMREDYLNDPELTSFTALDAEDFHE